MPETLKPCPLCGKPIRTGDFSVQHWFLFCECGLEFAPDGIRTREELIEVWNRRPSGWISCKDRLPGFGMRVLAGSSMDVSEAFFDGSVFVLTDGQLLPDIREKLQDDVTHWMPLPQPPEVEK